MKGKRQDTIPRHARGHISCLTWTCQQRSAKTLIPCMMCPALFADASDTPLGWRSEASKGHLREGAIKNNKPKRGPCSCCFQECYSISRVGRAGCRGKYFALASKHSSAAIGEACCQRRSQARARVVQSRRQRTSQQSASKRAAKYGWQNLLTAGECSHHKQSCQAQRRLGASYRNDDRNSSANLCRLVYTAWTGG